MSKIANNLYKKIFTLSKATGNVLETTYEELLDAKSKGELLPGQFYRIIDYVTTTSDTESRSMGHQFDIIVLALNESTLSEEAFASHHNGDTYFANSNIAAWKIWYCLENNNLRFSWADTENGKGVIYRMIDEFQNDVPYDFKNIQFKRYAIGITQDFQESASYLDGLCVSTRSLPNTNSVPFTVDLTTFKWYYTFSQLGGTWDVEATDSSMSGSVKQTNNVYIANRSYRAPYALNNVVIALGPCMAGNIMNASQYSDLPAGQNCSFKEACCELTIMGDVSNLRAATQFRNNIILGADFRHNNCGTDFQDNIMCSKAGFSFNTFKERFRNNVIFCTTEFSGNTFDDNCWSNKIIAARVRMNIFNNLTYTSFNLYEKNLQRNNFAQPCNSVTFTGGNCQCNEFGSLMQTCEFIGGVGYTRTKAGMRFVRMSCAEGYDFISVDIDSILEGTSTNPIEFRSSDFCVKVENNSVGNTKNVRIEADTDKNLVASWRGTGGVLVEKVSTDNGRNWTNLT